MALNLLQPQPQPSQNRPNRWWRFAAMTVPAKRNPKPLRVEMAVPARVRATAMRAPAAIGAWAAQVSEGVTAQAIV